MITSEGAMKQSGKLNQKNVVFSHLSYMNCILVDHFIGYGKDSLKKFLISFSTLQTLPRKVTTGDCQHHKMMSRHLVLPLGPPLMKYSCSPIPKQVRPNPE